MPTKRKKTSPPNANVELYENLIASIPGLERKGDANPYTSMNGNMFTLLHQSSRLAIRLPEDKRLEFLKKYLAISYEYVRTLRPKPTKKKS